MRPTYARDGFQPRGRRDEGNKHAERILAWLEAHDRLVARLLRPGLHAREIEGLETELGWRLPMEVAQFFQWCNGVEYNSKINLNDVYFFPWYYPLSIELVH